MNINMVKVQENMGIFPESDIRSLCDKIILEGDFPYEPGRNNIFEIECENESKWEGLVIEKGIDINAYYILFLKKYAFEFMNNEKRSPLLESKPINLKMILSPEMIKGGEKIIKDFDGFWPSFHETNFTIINKSSDIIILDFNNGYLNDRKIEIILYDILSEDYDNSLQSFTNEKWITDIEFRRRENCFEFRIVCDFQKKTLPKEFDISQLDNPRYDSKHLKDLWIIEEYKNYGAIRCREIEIKEIL